MLRVAAGPAFAYSLVPDAIAETQRRLPRVSVTLSTRLNEATLPMLSSGDLDVVLGGLPDVARRDPDVTYEPVMAIRHLVFARRRHPLRRHRVIKAAAMAGYPWIWLEEAVAARDQLRQYLRQENVDLPAASVATTSVQTGLRLMQGSDYLMVLPSSLEPAAAQFQLLPLDLAGDVGRFEAGLIYRASALRLRAFSTFRESLLRAVNDAATGRGTASRRRNRVAFGGSSPASGN